MPIYVLVLFCSFVFLSLGCQQDDTGQDDQAIKQLPYSKNSNPPPWDGVKLEYFDTTHPDYYELSIRVKKPQDRQKYKLSFMPPLPVKVSHTNDKDNVIQKHSIDVRKISLGHHTFEARFTHQDGRVHREQLSFHRQPALQVDDQGVISCKPAQCNGQVKWSGEISLKVEAGTTVVFDQNVVVAQDEPIHFGLNIIRLATKTPHLFNTELAPSSSQWILQKKLMLIFSDKSRTEYNLKWDRKRALSAVKAALEPLRAPGNSQGIKFPNEQTKKSRKKNGLLILPQLVSRNVSHVTDIRWVAFIDEHQRSQDCGSYRNLKTNNKRIVKIQYTDLKVTMFDRHTGQQVSQRSFRAPHVPCPKRKSTSFGMKSNVNYGDVYAWLNQRID
jgi:hypothetical protein